MSRVGAWRGRALGVISLLVSAGCGSEGAPPSAASTVTPARAVATVEPAARPLSLAEVRTRSTCAFDSIQSLCDAFREHLGSSDDAWTSERCALGPATTRDGPFAEARLVAIHSGRGAAADAPIAERSLLGSVLRGRADDDVTTNVLLAARVGEAWFPIHLYEPRLREPDVEPGLFAWQLDDEGRALEWTDTPPASRRDDPYGWGEVVRTLAVVDHGVPVEAVRATLERWHSDVDLACTRACNTEPSPPAYPGCELRCASRARATRSWERAHDEVRLGATTIERTGAHADALELETEAARTVRLAEASPDMLFCAFVPVVHARPRETPRTDADSLARLERAHAILAVGGGHAVPGLDTIVAADAPRSIVVIDATEGTSCGGGGCATALSHRTLEGPFPEEGVQHFAFDRGPRAGCEAGVLPGETPTLVVVAPVPPDAPIGCGFSGWDGARERRWVVTRVLE